jgi:hypothetical protein
VRRASFRGRIVVPEPLLYRLSRICTKTVQRERQSKYVRERELLNGREEILTPDPCFRSTGYAGRVPRLNYCKRMLGGRGGTRTRGPLLGKQVGKNTKCFGWCRLQRTSSKFPLLKCICATVKRPTQDNVFRPARGVIPDLCRRIGNDLRYDIAIGFYS